MQKQTGNNAAEKNPEMIRVSGFPRMCALLFVVLLSAGCLYQPEMEVLHPGLSVKTVWKRFQAVQPETSFLDRGCRLKASLHFFSPQQSQRILLELWGNYALPLRLNFKAGFGKTFALWRVGADRWLGYVPQHQKAYTHPDSRIGVRRMGVESPFDIRELLFLLSGHWEGLIASEYQTGRYLAESGYRFTFPPGQRIREIILDHNGLPLAMRGGGRTDWSIELGQYKEQQGRMIPFRVHLQNERQEEVLIAIKDFEPLRDPWPEDRLELRLPEDTLVVPLDVS